jgi:hypothetical protein
LLLAIYFAPLGGDVITLNAMLSRLRDWAKAYCSKKNVK